jgi:glycosyltransferase involved in cell wall biosynthesis
LGNLEQLTVSAVIPTLGRRSILKAVGSVLNQTKPVNEIIVVVAGNPDFTQELPDDARIRLIFPPENKNGFWTAAYNRNYGIQSATSDLIALLDDDDCWKPKKIEILLGSIQDLNTVFSSRSEYCLNSGRKQIRPRRTFKPSKGILESYYGRPRISRNPVYISTASIMLSRDLALKVPQDEHLPSYEDTWWLHQLQVAGAVFVQNRSVLVEINAEPSRSTARETLEKNIAWADRLSMVCPTFGKNFLTGIALRNFAFHGKVEEIVILMKKARELYELNHADILRLNILLFFAKISDSLRKIEIHKP